MPLRSGGKAIKIVTSDPNKKARQRRLRREARHAKNGRTEFIDSKLESQKMRCAICGERFTVALGGGNNEVRTGNHKPYRLDHDHSCCPTGGCIKCWRGLLCNKCNRGLGMFDDNIRLLAAAIVYLQDYEAVRESTRN